VVFVDSDFDGINKPGMRMANIKKSGSLNISKKAKKSGRDVLKARKKAKKRNKNI